MTVPTLNVTVSPLQNVLPTMLVAAIVGLGALETLKVTELEALKHALGSIVLLAVNPKL